MFQINALAKNVFKAAVCAVIPTDKIDENGETVKAEAHFIATFQSVSEEETEALVGQLNGVNESDLSRVSKLLKEQTRAVFIGFEKHPKHPFPFKNGDVDVQSSPETVALLLNSKEVVEAVRKAYNEARAGGVADKNLKK
ncbi:MAG: hypothetical protein E6Q75_02495 [Rheinheimera sp.]|nr:MAG: hypothetical protein E6Q75_02495 [Rheinheimera sp.]